MISGIRTSLSDPVKIDEIGDSVDSYIYPGIDQQKAVSWIEQNVAGVPTTTFLSFTVTSIAPRLQVQLAPYLVIDVIRVEPIPQPVVAVYKGERGAGGGIRYFIGALTSEARGFVAAPHIDGETFNFAEYDYYRLSPGEAEIMMLYLTYEPGYVYTFRIGVQFRYDGANRVHWLPDTYRRGIPNQPFPTFAWNHQLDTVPHPDYDSPDAAREWRIKTKRFEVQNRAFTLSQIRPRHQ